ncbi:MAG: GAF domain-containing protein [Proteobacteria bacterium]|nr:GAF domain-containing protein [Pseudomonadota bacterium]
MRKRVAIFGATEEALRLLPLLAANPDIEIAHIYDPESAEALARARALSPEIEADLAARLTADPTAFAARTHLAAVIDAGGEDAFAHEFPSAAAELQVVSPLTARLLWGYGAATEDRKSELLQALAEVVESVNLTVDADELFERMLEIAVGVTGADRGSLMLLDPETGELTIRVASGIERELWPKIRVALGEGIAGRVAADARPLRLRGKADRQAFAIVRERLDVESALCVPLVHHGNVLGVLNVHHSTRPDAFGDDDLRFVEQLAHLDARIIARAQEHEALRDRATRYEAVRQVRAVLTSPDPLPQRLTALCQFVASRVGGGIATLYASDRDEGDLRLTATSLEGGGFGGEYRVTAGQGIDGRAARERVPQLLRREDGALAYASLPLLAGERLVGVLSLQAGGEPPRGRAAEESLLEIAAAVAEGLAQAEREDRMATRANRLSAINETGIRMISTTDLSDVVRLASSSAAMVLDADHAVLRLRDEQSGRFVIRSYFGAADGRAQEKLFRLDKRVSVDVLKRRSAHLLRDLATYAPTRDVAGEFRSALVAPLRRQGALVGTLALYDKVNPERFVPGRFSDEDFQVFAKLVSYVERAVDNALFHHHSRQHRNFDEETGLPNESYVMKRIHQEVARAHGRDQALAVATCRIENLDDITRASHGSQAHRVVRRTADALRAHVRDFDVLGRTADAEFCILMPEPGPQPGERVLALARAVADDVAKDDALNEPVRVVLAFGHATHPEEGSDREALLERAAVARIRMV